jgi:hypothetical protein
MEKFNTNRLQNVQVKEHYYINVLNRSGALANYIHLGKLLTDIKVNHQDIIKIIKIIIPEDEGCMSLRNNDNHLSDYNSEHHNINKILLPQI